MLERTGGRAPHFVPRDDNTPEHREANKHEGEEYLRIIMDEAGAARVAGEDLGVVPDYVRPSLQSLGIAGFKIPQWEIRDGMVIPGEVYERAIRGDLRDTRSPTNSRFVGRSARAS